MVLRTALLRQVDIHKRFVLSISRRFAIGFCSKVEEEAREAAFNFHPQKFADQFQEGTFTIGHKRVETRGGPTFKALLGLPIRERIFDLLLPRSPFSSLLPSLLTHLLRLLLQPQA